jgi:uncharacterized protein YjbI with pentapeptide repeats
MELIENEKFENIDFQIDGFKTGEYENCIFLNCNFHGVDISSSIFVDAEFIDCNLSLIKIRQVVFRDVRFKGCKMVGILFDTCNEYGLTVGFDHCILDNSSFYGTKLKSIQFQHSSLKEVDFANTDLSSSIFSHCDFLNAVFENTNLEKADLSSSFNYVIDIEKNRLKKSKHSREGVLGLLNKFDLKIE